MEENIIPPSPATSKSGRLRADDKDKKQDKNKTNEKEDDEGSEIVEEAEDDEEEDDDENRSEEEGDDDENRSEEEDDDNEEEEDKEDWSESDLDEEPGKFATLKEFYKPEKGANTFHTLLVMFFRHLQDINGGACKERQVMLRTQNVRKLKETLDPSGKDNDIKCLVKDGGSFIWRGWAKPVLDSKERRPGIVKSYFCSVSKFLDFILDHTGNEVEGMPPISEESVKRAALVLPRVKSWGCSITKMYAADTGSKTLKDRQEAINPESVEDMMTTKAATETISLLKKSQVQKVDEKEFVKIRDFCIARLQLENGQRPGPLESATLQEFQRSEQKKSGYIMHVAGHKNARLGPAPIYLSTNLHTNINAYIKNVRPFFADHNTQEVFVKSTDGTAFKEGKTGKRVTE